MSATPTPVSSLRFVPLRDLTVDHKLWKNPRTVTGLDDGEIAELGRDIKDRGIQVPLLVQKIKSGQGGVTNLVLEGQRRVLAATEVLKPDAEIPVADRTPDAIELTEEIADQLMLDMLAVGTKREGLSSYELSEVAERLRKRGRTLAEIGRAIGRDESWVSKMLKARSTATPKLMHQWRKGDITDEQFKDLAAVKEPDKQVEAAKEVAETRKSGDRAEARVRAKEIVEQAKKDNKSNGHSGVTRSATPPPVVRGPQEDLFGKGGKPANEDKPERPKMRSRAVLDDILHMASKRPPTSDYVKGVIDGIRYVVGELEADDFSKAWGQYVARVEGRPRPAKKAKVKKGAKARRPAKKAAAKKKGKRK